MAELIPIPEIPGFEEPALELYRDELARATCVLDYGSGGSTLWAADSADRTVFAVESDRDWLDRVVECCKARRLPGTVIPVWADIGPTGDWGHPKTFDEWRSFPGYARLPWKNAKHLGLNPDLVVIDGRFRLACFLASCVSTTRTLRILVDDYVGRPNYKPMERLVEPNGFVGRMAVFDVKPHAIAPATLLEHIDAFYRPWH